MSQAFNAVAAVISAASVFYLRTLIHTSSKIITQILGIPIYNADPYVSKLKAYMFIFNIIGCLIECILYYSIHYKLKNEYLCAINNIVNAIKKHSESIKPAIVRKTTSINEPDKNFGDSYGGSVINTITSNSDLFSLEKSIIKQASELWVAFQKIEEERHNKILVPLLSKTTILFSSEMAKDLIDNTEKIKNVVTEQANVLIKVVNEDIEKLNAAIKAKQGQIQKKVIEWYDRGNEGALQMIKNVEEIIDIVLNMDYIETVINNSSLSYCLVKGVLCFDIRARAKEIEKNPRDSSELAKFLKEIPQEKTRLFEMFIQNIICDIIIEMTNEINTVKNDQNPIFQVLKHLEEKIKFTPKLNKITVMLKEKERTGKIWKMADELAKTIVTINELESEMKELLSKKLGQTWIPETLKTIENTISRIIKNNAKKIACHITFDGTNAAQVVKKVLIEELNEILTETNADEMVEKLSKLGAVKVRKIMSVLSLTSMFVIKITLLIFLHRSKSLGYYLYVIMNVESLILGIFQMSLFTLAAENASHVRLSIGFSTFIVLLLEVAVDKVFYARPAQTVNVQVWVACISNLVAIPLWACSIFADQIGLKEEKDISKVDDSHHVKKLWSPYLMLPFASIFRDFLVPLILPLALISYRPSWITRYAFPVVLLAGILLVTVMDDNDELDLNLWWLNDCLWILLGPQIVAFVLSLLAIHTKTFLTRCIQNNTGYVLFMCFAVQFCYSVMGNVSYVGVAKFVAGTNKYFSGYIEGHVIICEILMFIYSSLSRGYDILRKEYGLGMNVPLEDSMDQPGPLGWITQVFNEALKVTTKDIMTSISDYL